MCDRDDNVNMHLASISVAPDTFLTEMYVTDYSLADEQSQSEKITCIKA